MVSPIDRFTLQAERDFRPSVRPVYRARPSDELPEHLGSCILLRVRNVPAIVTAAHIFDQIPEYSLYIGGRPGTKAVPMLGGKWASTSMLGENRKDDHYDVVVWLPPLEAIPLLGAVDFLDSKRISTSDHRLFSEARLYTAFGYPISRNKNAIDHATRSISTHISMYTAHLNEMPKLKAKLKIDGSDHLFLRFEKVAFTGDGEQVNTFGPRGLSGGAVLELGDFSLPESLLRNPEGAALLAGMVIEYHKEHRALVAVKMRSIVESIRRVLSQL